MVSELCGIHAQVMPSAEMSLGLRVARFTARDLADALWERRELVKIRGIRGTVHLVPAREYGWWLAILRAMRADGRDLDPVRLRYLGITERQFFDASAAIVDACAGQALTLAALGEKVIRAVGPWGRKTVSAFGGAQPVWHAALGHAMLEAAIVFGPPQGVRVTFVRAADWIGRQPVPPADEALDELFVRWLRAYGPASEREFAQWDTLAPKRVLATRERVGAKVETVTVDGVSLLQVARDMRPRTARSTLLLPRFDAYVVGSHPRDVLCPPEIVAKAAATGLLPKRNGTGRVFLTGPMPVLVIDGVVAGLWESKRTAKRVNVRVQPFARMEATRRAALERAAKRIGDTWGVATELEVGAIATRPHL